MLFHVQHPMSIGQIGCIFKVPISVGMGQYHNDVVPAANLIVMRPCLQTVPIEVLTDSVKTLIVYSDSFAEALAETISYLSWPNPLGVMCFCWLTKTVAYYP